MINGNEQIDKGDRFTNTDSAISEDGGDSQDVKSRTMKMKILVLQFRKCERTEIKVFEIGLKYRQWLSVVLRLTALTSGSLCVGVTAK